MSTLAIEAQRVAGEGAEGLMERTVILHLTLGGLGTKKRVKRNDVRVRKASAAEAAEEDGEQPVLALETSEGDPDQAFVHVTKDIIQSEELTLVRKQMSAIRGFVRGNSVPSFLRGGMYLIRVDAVEEIDEQLGRMKVTLRGLVERFVQAYPQLVLDAQAKLGTLYRAKDYPTVEQIRAAFTWDLRLLTFSTPTTLQGISQALFEREKVKLTKAVESAAEDIKLLLRAEAKQILDHMVDRLTPGPDGKPKVFRASLVGNAAEFLRSFNSRNVVDDRELGEIMAQVGKMLEGVDADQLRKEEGLRDAVRARATEICSRLDGMVTARPKRDITFDEAEA